MSVSIDGKWALITGASRGVGMRVAKALAEAGCRLILHSRKIQHTRELEALLVKNGSTVFSVNAELSDINQVDRLIQEVKSVTHNHLDILYNNAAQMTHYMSDFYNTAESDYTRSFLVNATVPAILCNAFVPQMLNNGWGRVVNVTSGIKMQPELMAYSCSKAALDRYVRDMVPTLEGTDVLMNLMDPGWLRTDLGGPNAPNHPDSVLPGALVPILLDKTAGSGNLYKAQDYVIK